VLYGRSVHVQLPTAHTVAPCCKHSIKQLMSAESHGGSELDVVDVVVFVVVDMLHVVVAVLVVLPHSHALAAQKDAPCMHSNKQFMSFESHIGTPLVVVLVDALVVLVVAVVLVQVPVVPVAVEVFVPDELDVARPPAPPVPLVLDAPPCPPPPVAVPVPVPVPYP
jgi:hypothetical protein